MIFQMLNKSVVNLVLQLMKFRKRIPYPELYLQLRFCHHFQCYTFHTTLQVFPIHK